MVRLMIVSVAPLLREGDPRIFVKRATIEDLLRRELSATGTIRAARIATRDQETFARVINSAVGDFAKNGGEVIMCDPETGARLLVLDMVQLLNRAIAQKSQSS